MPKRAFVEDFEYIVVGTGPGGAPVARELARAGKSVCMVERGIRHEKALGFPLGPRILEGAGFFCRSVEGTYIARGVTVGGSSVVYNGNVFDPPQKVFDQMGINFSREAQSLREEIGVQSMPERFFENASGGQRLRDAAQSMGLYFEPQDKFVDPEKCKPGCDWCMLGCPRGAKWTTRNLVDQAMASGARLLVGTAVEKVIMKNNRAAGVQTKDRNVINAANVIVAAGGIGTAALLLRSGISEAGKNFYIDPMNIVVGYARDRAGGAWGEMSFTHAVEELSDSEGFIIGNISAQAVAFTGLMRANVLKHNLPKSPKMKNGVGLFVKLSDSHQGWIKENGKISKPFTLDDKRRMKRGTDLATDILCKAGVPKASIAVGQGIGGHPGGTAAMGVVVDKDFATRVPNLYVSDGSVIPESPGVPPSLTIMAMSQYLGKKLVKK